jgi:FkbM family methyltransferase
MESGQTGALRNHLMDLNAIDSTLNRSPASVLDIGCNIGQFYRLAKRHWPAAEYFLIDGNESVRESLEQLQVPFEIALLSNEIKTVELYKNSHNLTCTGTSMYRENTEHYSDENVLIEHIRTNTLANLFQERVFDLIKLDTQGSEIDILTGGMRMMSEAALIIVEASLIDWNIDAPNAADVNRFMKMHGFDLVTTIDMHYLNGEIIQKDFLFKNTARCPPHHGRRGTPRSRS